MLRHCRLSASIKPQKNHHAEISLVRAISIGRNVRWRVITVGLVTAGGTDDDINPRVFALHRQGIRRGGR